MSEQRFALMPEQASALRVAHRQLGDAQRALEIAASRARVAVGEAMEAQIACHREIAYAYGFDPDLPARLLPDGVLIVGEP